MICFKYEIFHLRGLFVATVLFIIIYESASDSQKAGIMLDSGGLGSTIIRQIVASRHHHKCL